MGEEAILNDLGKIVAAAYGNLICGVAGDTSFYPFAFMPCLVILNIVCGMAISTDNGCIAFAVRVAGDVGLLVATFAGEGLFELIRSEIRGCYGLVWELVLGRGMA